jgi:hypothetical protein
MLAKRMYPIALMSLQVKSSLAEKIATDSLGRHYSRAEEFLRLIRQDGTALHRPDIHVPHLNRHYNPK